MLHFELLLLIVTGNQIDNISKLCFIIKFWKEHMQIHLIRLIFHLALSYWWLVRVTFSGCFMFFGQNFGSWRGPMNDVYSIMNAASVVQTVIGTGDTQTPLTRNFELYSLSGSGDT